MHEKNLLLKSVIERVRYEKNKGGRPDEFTLEIRMKRFYL